jgi:hypothetical protein
VALSRGIVQRRLELLRARVRVASAPRGVARNRLRVPYGTHIAGELLLRSTLEQQAQHARMPMARSEVQRRVAVLRVPRLCMSRAAESDSKSADGAASNCFRTIWHVPCANKCPHSVANERRTK